jgi:hypothetical protein
MNVKMQIVALHPERCQVEVRYFPADLPLDAAGNPAWWLGPWNFDIPIGPDGNPIAGGDLLTYLSNACPVALVEREEKLRSANVAALRAMTNQVGQVHDVVQTSPIVESTLPIDPLAPFA